MGAKGCLLSLFFLMATILGSPTQAQVAQNKTQGDYQWTVAPYAWLTGLGGFSVSSALTWDTTGLIGYTFWQHGTLLAGYRAVGVTCSEGSGNNAFTFDATLSGPILGVALTF